MTVEELLKWFSENVDYNTMKDFIVCLVDDEDAPYMLHDIEIDKDEKIIVMQ
jgi:hypothetical protein